MAIDFIKRTEDFFKGVGDKNTSTINIGDSLIGMIPGLGDAWMGQKQAQANDYAFKEQQRFNDEMLHRDDNAVQRRSADLEAAGLSPTLAAGSSASTSGSASPATRQFNNPDSSKDFMQVAQLALAFMTGGASLASTLASTKATELQNRITEHDLKIIEKNPHSLSRNQFGQMASQLSSLTDEELQALQARINHAVNFAKGGPPPEGTETDQNFFNWIQKKLGIPDYYKPGKGR